MHEAWMPLHVLGVLAGALGWAAAAMVYLARPGASMNRRLALLFAIEGSSSLVIGGQNVLSSLAIVDGGLPGQAVINFTLVLLPGAYVAFVAATPSPASAFLRGTWGRLLLVATLPGALVAWFVVNGASFGARGADTWAALMIWLVLGGVFGLVVSLAALVRARTPEARARARLYAIAFGAHDVLWAFGSAADVLFPVPDGVYWFFAFGTPAFGTLALVPLLAYGALKYQVLDLDLKLKVGIRRGVVGGAFVVVFFAVEQLSQEWVSEAYGALAGAAAAGMLLFVQAPLRRAAERVAERALPGVAPTDDYILRRRLQIYRSAVESVLEEGHVPPRSRALLERLRAELELPHGEAAAIEQDAGAMPVAL